MLHELNLRKGSTYQSFSYKLKGALSKNEEPRRTQ